MFKQLIMYRLTPDTCLPAFADAEEALAASAFQPIGETQERSVGWTPPRGEASGALVEAIGGQWVMKIMIESKSVPGSAIAELVDRRCGEIEASAGRKPGKKERRDLKDEALQELLPKAFPKKSSVTIWIDPESRLIAVDAGSQSRADLASTLLVEAFPRFALHLVATNQAPQSAMAEWLGTMEGPAAFVVDRECELKATDETKAVVRYGRHPLDIAEVAQHITAGKLPTKLALTWDDRVSFLLTSELQLKKIEFSTPVDGAPAGKGDDFDADVAIATGELQRLLPALIMALGGEVAPGAQDIPAPAAEHHAPAESIEAVAA